ncbi:hypothetical protein XO10_01675 [Marinitoga sp. 1135]|uniref:RNA-binding protein containing Zn ribbon n=1 Tax=Marinitoga piezophila (strain DSM 14283 / JCM 11233 / KA3) TaxID=443254 RepID=H2J3Y8_MARPK|nr:MULTISPECIES: DciA family protein [Marinitoga]AEX84716.1 Protein of unknown function (DUF721) [Marinitoga piezophila KA3]APT75241.1 hypothetical protein LN42_01645 [Marinitoga sp. 1137]NUU95018.1 hypothetical protein [Marinitoga sp. 1135]NUU96974.1 hypothetical protein [Marinitoga sp. 1138]
MKEIKDILYELSSKNNVIKKIMLLDEIKNKISAILDKYNFTSVEVVDIDLKTSTLFLYVENNYIKQEILFKKNKLIKEINNSLQIDRIKSIKFTGGAVR